MIEAIFSFCTALFAILMVTKIVYDHVQLETELSKENANNFDLSEEEIF